MRSKTPILTIMVALNCEAKPWVDFYGLKRTIDRPFSFYSKAGVNVEIVITGIGALAMSTAVGWIGGRAGLVSRVWLNLGIAGHLSRPVGEAVRTHSYIDAVDLRHHFTPLTASWSADSDALMSVNAPTGNYPDAAMVDMEGVAFYKAATLFSSAELIESIKVISDNENNSVEDLNASKISELLQPHVLLVNCFSDNLLALSPLSREPAIELALDDMRMTHSQRQQLARLLEKATVLDLHQDVADLNLSKALKIDNVLSQLHSLIDVSAPFVGGTHHG